MNHLSKTNFQRTGIISMAVVAANLVMLPLSASAAPGFCANIDSTSSTINGKISGLTTKLTTAQTDRTSKIATNRQNWDAALAANRTKWDAQRQAEYTKLQAKATTDTEKAAVNAYVSTLQTAIQTRRTANDSARTTSRSGEDSLIASHQQTVNGQVATFTSSVSAAESTAKTGCQATNPDNATIHIAFVSTLKTARETFKADRTSDGKIADQIKQLARARAASVQTNEATFKTAADQARSTLKAAFGSQSGNV